MAKTYLNQIQQLRAQQVTTTHRHLKELNLATEEALKYHDKYLAAMEKVMSCLLNNSDAVEDVRKHLPNNGGAEVVSTFATAGRLAAAFNNWRLSQELQDMRVELELLKKESTTGRHTAKDTKNVVQGLERVAKKCANVNSAEFQEKIDRQSGKSRDKLVREQQEENARLHTIESGIIRDMTSLAVSWSAKLVDRGESLYRAFAAVGRRAVAAFPGEHGAPHAGAYPPAAAAAAAPPHPLSTAAPASSCSAAAGDYGAPAAYVSAEGASANAAAVSGGTAAGVPLEFNAAGTKLAPL